MSRRRLVCCLGLLVLVPATSSLRAFAAARPQGDVVAKALETLASARPYKVRLQAVNVLGRIDDPRAAAALAEAVAQDRHPLVRVVVLKLLAKREQRGFIDAGGREAVKRALADRNPMIRTAAQRAWADISNVRRSATQAGTSQTAFEAQATTTSLPPPRGGRRGLTVSVRPMGDRSGHGSPTLRERLRAEVARALSGLPGVTMGDPTRSDQSFIVDGSIAKLDLVTRPLEVEASCEVSLILSRGTRGILLTTSGEAAVIRPRVQYRPAQRAQMEEDALIHAVKSATESLAEFLARQ